MRKLVQNGRITSAISSGRQRRGAREGQGRQADEPHGDVLGGVAEGADGAGQFWYAAVAEGDAMAAALPHDKQ
jgi:hypothetical protein